MRTINKVELKGTIAKCNIKIMNGFSFINMILCVPTVYTSNGDKVIHSDYMRVEFWKDVTDEPRVIKEGDTAHITGKLSSVEYIDHEGNPHSNMIIKAETVKIIEQ